MSSFLSPPRVICARPSYTCLRLPPNVFAVGYLGVFDLLFVFFPLAFCSLFFFLLLCSSSSCSLAALLLLAAFSQNPSWFARFGLLALVGAFTLIFFRKVGRWTARFSCITRNGFSTVQSDGCFVRGHGEFDCCFCMETTFFADHCTTYTFRCRSNLSPNFSAVGKVRSKSLLVGDEIDRVGVRHNGVVRVGLIRRHSVVKIVQARVGNTPSLSLGGR